jgi:hypothetical protein
MTLDKDLKIILEEADKITMNDLEFDKLFREQSKILCDVKTLLQKDKDITNSSKCNLSTIKTTSKFKQHLNNLKNKYSITNQNTKSKRTRTKSKSHRKTKYSSNTKSSKKLSKKRSKNTIGKINNNYPIILLKDKKPYKNVIMVKE